jgi:hypothetical protein
LTWVFLGFLILGKGPRGHEIIHHAGILKLVLDGVHMVQAGLCEESLEVVYWWPCLALATMRGSCNTHHVGAVRLLVIIIVIDCDRNQLRVPLLPLLVALGVLLGGLEDDIG